MVTRLWGKVGGVEVSFNQDEQGRWTAAVPASPNGIFVLELYAEDSAGNTGYFATLRYAFDSSQMCWRVEIIEVSNECSIKEISQILLGDPLCAEISMSEVSVDVDPDELRADVIKCEVCGR